MMIQTDDGEMETCELGLGNDRVREHEGERERERGEYVIVIANVKR